jgi:hypothetical protein
MDFVSSVQATNDHVNRLAFVFCDQVSQVVQTVGTPYSLAPTNDPATKPPTQTPSNFSSWSPSTIPPSPAPVPPTQAPVVTAAPVPTEAPTRAPTSACVRLATPQAEALKCFDEVGSAPPGSTLLR